MSEARIKKRLQKLTKNKRFVESPPFNPDGEEPYCSKPYNPDNSEEMHILPYEGGASNEMRILPFVEGNGQCGRNEVEPRSTLGASSGGRMVKGSKAAKDHMAKIRAMKGKGGVKKVKNNGKGWKEDLARFLYKTAPDVFSNVPVVGSLLKPVMKGAIKGISKLSPGFDIEGQGLYKRPLLNNYGIDGYGGAIPWGLLGKIAAPAASAALSYGVNKLLKKLDEPKKTVQRPAQRPAQRPLQRPISYPPTNWAEFHKGMHR
jgi:hypothetical protein